MHNMFTWRVMGDRIHELDQLLFRLRALADLDRALYLKLIIRDDCVIISFHPDTDDDAQT